MRFSEVLRGFRARAWLGSVRYGGASYGKGFVARLGAVWRRSCKAWYGHQGENNE